jgi:hypothetical protein
MSLGARLFVLACVELSVVALGTALQQRLYMDRFHNHWFSLQWNGSAVSLFF